MFSSCLSQMINQNSYPYPYKTLSLYLQIYKSLCFTSLAPVLLQKTFLYVVSPQGWEPLEVGCMR